MHPQGPAGVRNSAQHQRSVEISTPGDFLPANSGTPSAASPYDAERASGLPPDARPDEVCQGFIVPVSRNRECQPSDCRRSCGVCIPLATLTAWS